jgi:hypothetical protein
MITHACHVLIPTHDLTLFWIYLNSSRHAENNHVSVNPIKPLTRVYDIISLILVKPITQSLSIKGCLRSSLIPMMQFINTSTYKLY